MIKNKFFLFFAVAALAVGLFFALRQSQETQNTRSRAATASTTLYFQPSSSGTNPIQKQTGESVALDMMVDPGQNLVSLLRIQIKYNPEKITLSPNDPFSVNTQAFPTIAEGPVVSGDTLSMTLSIGPDGTKAIQSPTKVGTFNFTAAESTNGTSTLISFTDKTTVLSISSNDSSYDNVLSSSTPATLLISGSSNNISPTITSNPSAAPTTAPSASPPDGGSNSTISFDILLHGVGSAGDNPNPSSSALSNKSPINPQRPLEVIILNTENAPVGTTSGAINYDAQTGSFKGSIPFDSSISEDNYVIKIKSPRYLRKRIPEIVRISPNRDNRIARIDLVAGDSNNDNRLDILDYNAFLDCGYGALNPLPNNDANSIFNSDACQNHDSANYVDINDDGIINSTDYNLFLRELSVQIGD